MTVEKQTVTFTSEGVTVEEERQAPLSDNTTPITVDQLDWGDFPIDNLTMEVKRITPVISEGDENALQKLEFEVERLERSSESGETASPDEFWDRVKAETGITKEDDEIMLSGEKNAKDNLIAFVEFLVTNDYLPRNRLPVKSGWKRFLINTEPVHQEGEDMVQEEEVVDGVFLETKYSRDDIKKKIRDLADQFGER